ncbi:MAG: hypothetical protein ACO1NQ_09125 [Flavobacteriales bacterium]
MQRTATFLAICALASACSTELDINAPYKNITVVEGLLNMRDSIHFIKINKGFLGEGDALVYAQIPDSNEWSGDAIEYARVVRRRNGQVLGTYELRDTIVSGREPGTFYGPDQRLYYFVTDYRVVEQIGGQVVALHLDEESDYAVELRIKGEDITATTNIVNDFGIQAADQSTEGNQVINLRNGSGFNSFELNWTVGRNGKRYVADYRFNYKEVRNGEVGELKTITKRMATVVRIGTTPGEDMSATIDGQRFFEDLAATIPNDPTVERRIFLGVDFIISVANDEFHTFLTLTEPVSGIIEDRPTYTNIVNGYGIFGSRYVKQVIGKRLGATSLDYLANSDLMASRRFCSGMPLDVLSPNYCP